MTSECPESSYSKIVTFKSIVQVPSTPDLEIEGRPKRHVDRTDF